MFIERCRATGHSSNETYAPERYAVPRQPLRNSINTGHFYFAFIRRLLYVEQHQCTQSSTLLSRDTAIGARPAQSYTHFFFRTQACPASERAVLLRRVREQVAHALRVAPLVVVPRDELHKVLVQRDARVRVEDRARGVAREVRRDDLLVRVREDARHRARRGLPHRRFDLVVGRALLEAHNEVHDGDVDRGHTEGETAARGN